MCHLHSPEVSNRVRVLVHDGQIDISVCRLKDAAGDPNRIEARGICDAGGWKRAVTIAKEY